MIPCAYVCTTMSLHLSQEFELDHASEVLVIDKEAGNGGDSEGRFLFRVTSGAREGEKFRRMVSAPRMPSLGGGGCTHP